MTKIDFYILKEQSATDRLRFACRLTEKAMKQKHDIYIHCNDAQQMQELNELLWSFKPTSFIPHSNTESDKSATSSQVSLGSSECPDNHHDVLINLSNQVPEFFSRFQRVSEIVIQDETITAATRENYRFYRDRGYQLDSHDLRK